MKVIIFAVALGITVVLQGCGGDSPSPTPAAPTPAPSPPTPAPTTPSPTPTPPTPAPTQSPDLVSCKENSKDPGDGTLCDNFYDTKVGIAISLMSLDIWSGKFPVTFNEKPPSAILRDKGGKLDPFGARSFSISNYKKATWLYPAVSKYGLAYGLGPESVLWTFFTTCSNDDKLCAQCTDGFKCPLDGVPGRRVMRNMKYDEFTADKNAIVESTGTKDCIAPSPHQYNEFDANGLSSTDILGVISINGGGAASRQPAPPDKDVCSFLKKANPNRKTAWPLYTYDAGDTTGSTLMLGSYLNCGGENSTAADAIQI